MTDARLVEGRIGSLPWLKARGDSTAVFRALGARARREIAYVLEHYPERRFLHDLAKSPEGAEQIAKIIEATKRDCAKEWSEFVAMAEGADVSVDELALLNLRGDLGATSVGCTDIAWNGERTLLAHNEDGLAIFEGRCFLVTLAIDTVDPVTAFWYPGLVPSNAFVLNGANVIWSMDHLSVATPAIAPGRHFTARKAQCASSLAESRAIFERLGSAGGFAYTVGDVDQRSIECFEVAAGYVSDVATSDDAHPYLWHANTMRYITAVGEIPDTESASRSGRLAALDDQIKNPDSESLLQLLVSPSDESGFYRSATYPDPLMTLCSIVCDMTSESVTIIPRGDTRVVTTLSSLARGPMSDHE
jgi:hypothetical protein